jgi:transcriptional regulator PpsR
MNGVNIAQPDVTLLLDQEGVIREATLSDALAGEGVESWLGRPWVETVADLGVDKVRRMVADTRTSRVSLFRQVTQCFPSGLELLMEYTTVRLGGNAGLLAIGKSLQAVAELQSRLIAAQQAMERDYWKLREIETRYRLLFDASNEAVLLIKAATLRVVEANPAAIRALGLSPVGREFVPELPAQEQNSFHAMLLRVREHGKAPGMLVHLGAQRDPWFIRASLMTAEPGPVFLLQLTSAGTTQLRSDRLTPVSIEKLIERGPDSFVVLDSEGVILRANRAFLDLIQTGAEGSVTGERLGRWLGRPGADLTVLLANVRRHGFVRLFSTSIHGELGSDTEVEISAVGDVDNEPRHIGVLLRDVGWKLPPRNHNSDQFNALFSTLTEQVGKNSLQKLVKDTVGIVERHYIEAALKLTGGNRTAAAEILGLSRQGLYAKLNRYGLDADLHMPSQQRN